MSVWDASVVPIDAIIINDKKRLCCTKKRKVRSYETSRQSSVSYYERSDERLFTCSYPGCNHSSNSASNLTDHTRIHSDERLFGCSYPGCNHSSNSASNLTDHKYTHINVDMWKL